MLGAVVQNLAATATGARDLCTPVYTNPKLIFPTMRSSLFVRCYKVLTPAATGNVVRVGVIFFGLSNKILPFFPHLSPTLSIIVKSIQLFPLFDFRNNKLFTVWGC
jgi:hypothetical protein